MIRKIVTGLCAGLLLAGCDARTSLDDTHSAIEKRYSDVAHLAPDQLGAQDVLLFDTRSPEEFAVSHIDGAIRLDPDMSPAEFKEIYGDQAAHKILVFYCSVGERSSAMASRIASVHSGPVYNLEKGLFGWHNDRRPLVSSSGPTDFIHPYDEKWGTLIDRQKQIKYN